MIGPDTPVIFLTAKTQAVDRKRLGGLGAAGLIAKPFDPMTLSDEVAARPRRPYGLALEDDPSRASPAGPEPTGLPGSGPHPPTSAFEHTDLTASAC